MFDALFISNLLLYSLNWFVLFSIFHALFISVINLVFVLFSIFDALSVFIKLVYFVQYIISLIRFCII